MKLQFYFVFIVLYFTGVLLLAVSLRNEDNRNFYKLCALNAEQSRLKQQLWCKQLRLEGLINPAAISRRLDY
jgi:hypothetical protein